MLKLYMGGTFITMEESQPIAEAVLTEDGIIRAVGTENEMRRLTGDAGDMEIVHMNGMTVLPGFIDGHSHLTAAAYQILNVNLNPPPTGTCSSREDVIEALKKGLSERNLKPGQWLMGMGYDNSAFPDGQHLTKEDLDHVSREIPVAALHVSGHLCVVNTKGMEVMGYLEEGFEVPAGGVVEKTGLLKEQAFLGSDKMTGPSQQEVLKAVGKASRLYASYGITTAQDARTRDGEYQLLKAAGQTGLLKTDVVSYLSPEFANTVLPKQFPDKNTYENHLRLGGVKLFLDGSPQGKTAWLSEPYYEVPEGEKRDYRGFPVQEESYVMSVLETAVENNWQVNVHANGDEAIEQLIRCYQTAIEKSGKGRELRPVVIHCQTVRMDQLDRMKEIGMTASFFLDHVYYWGDYHYESVLGPERAERISPLKSALERGIPFTLHQDTPVVPPNVLFSVHNAVNRRTRSGRILGKDQRITVQEALKAVTVCGAYQLFEENHKGSIAPGKKADFVVLKENPLEVSPEKIKDITIAMTIKEGMVIYENI